MRYIFNGYLSARDIEIIERSRYPHAILLTTHLDSKWIDEHLTVFEWQQKSAFGDYYTRSSHLYMCFSPEGYEDWRFYFFKSAADKQKVIDLLPEIVVDAEPFKTVVELRVPQPEPEPFTSRVQRLKKLLHV